MDPNKWKKIKHSGNFKRKMRKTFHSLKSEPTISLFSVPHQSDGQARMTVSGKGSVYTDILF